MDHIFRKTYTVTDDTVDRFDRLRPSTLLFYIQDAATSHCAHLGMDWNTMAARGLFWAVTRTRVEITRLPAHGETVTVETWIMKTTRVAYPRAAAMYDSQGNLLLRTLSLWVLMDLDKRTMVLPGKSGVGLDGEDRGTELKSPAGLAPLTQGRTSQRTVAYTDIDINGHLNNARYLDWVSDLNPSDFHRDRQLRAMTVCYLAEAREGQTLDLIQDFDPTENCLRAEFSREGHRVFGVRMDY